MTKRTRFLWAVAIFLAVFGASLVYRLNTRNAINDLYFPICGAASLLRGGQPYLDCPIIAEGVTYPQNPMTTILAAVPVAPLGWGFGGILLWSFIVGVMVYGLLKETGLATTGACIGPLLCCFPHAAMVAALPGAYVPAIAATVNDDQAPIGGASGANESHQTTRTGLRGVRCIDVRGLSHMGTRVVAQHQRL